MASADPPDSSSSAPRRLSLGQRILTALPTLRPPSRPEPPSSSAPAPPAEPRRPAPKAPPTKRRPAAQGERADDWRDRLRDAFLKPPPGIEPVKRPPRDGDGDQEDPETESDAPKARKTTQGATGRGATKAPAATSTAPKARGASGRQPTKQDPYPQLSSAELQEWIKRLDDRERLFALLAAPLGAALGITVMLVSLHVNPPVGAKGHEDPSTIVTDGVIAIAFAIVVLISALVRRRSFTVFALLFLGYGSGIYGLVPFWGLAGWLFFRSYKMQRALTARGEHPRQLRAQQQRRKKAAGPGQRAGGGLLGRKQPAPEPAGPGPNRRYTPPKPRGEEKAKAPSRRSAGPSGSARRPAGQGAARRAPSGGASS
ncbi:hypothetical protein ACFFRE_11715 [Aciditerrimonas ferrireducens]|uniref:Uncharacterized protein n=1 Tax=Aciditerrimonas ferrireducens TaxID=667306 RepID=A0ABV6C985_9ACTN